MSLVGAVGAHGVVSSAAVRVAALRRPRCRPAPGPRPRRRGRRPPRARSTLRHAPARAWLPALQRGPQRAARLARQQAGDLVLVLPAVARVGGRRELRVDALVRLAHVGAARVERAARRLEDQRRRAAGDRHELLAARRVQARDRLEQPPGVGVLGHREDRVLVGVLDDPPRVHHADVVGHLGDHAEVVGDHHDRGVELALQALDEVEDLRLHGDVERGRRLVGDQQLGVVDERHRDHHALAHAAGELVRIGVHAPARLGDADQPEHLDRAIERLRLGDVAVGLDGLHQLVADLVEGMQRRQRVLEDHRDVVAAQPAHVLVGGRQQVLAVEDDRARDLRVAGEAGQAHHGQRRDALARARLAHDAQRLAAVHACRRRRRRP